MTEGEEKEEEIENLFENMMKENSPNMVKKYTCKSRKLREFQTSWVQGGTHIIIKSHMIKDKERILKAAREKETVTYKGVPIRLSADFSKETLQAKRV